MPRTRITVSFSESEVTALESHPDYTGDLKSLVTALALAAVGTEPADPYASHRSRPRGPGGKILAPWQALLHEVIERYHEGAKDPAKSHERLHYDLTKAKSADRVREILAPILMGSGVQDGDGCRSFASALEEDWNEVRNFAAMASSAASFRKG